MGEFLESEKLQQAKFKKCSPYFSDPARDDGFYRGKLRGFCLPVECTVENLFPGIRQSAPAYFASQRIKWHDGKNAMPSNHLCSSQVCCLNFLFPFANQPRALAEVLRPVFPSIRIMLPMEDKQHVAFEWIGEKNYLKEKTHRDGSRTRGAHFTSADAAVKFEQADGKKHIVLIEWKYTESYVGTSLKQSRSGTDRTAIYKRLFDLPNCPINKELLPDFDSLFHEPFYQFMRQQFLANEMERAQELDASMVSVLHISPARNTDFRKVTSPNLKTLGETATDAWKKLVRAPGRFISISTEQLFGRLTLERFPEMQEWLEYISSRYPWVQAISPSVS